MKDSGINPSNPRINDIRPFTADPSWYVDIGLQYLEAWVTDHLAKGLNLDPDFQRGHVWTEAQQIAFMEFFFRGGKTGRDLYFNSPGWGTTLGELGEYVIVDGKQRLTAALRFVRNEIPIFGYRLCDFTDAGFMRFHLGFKWHINTLATRAEVLTWYLEFNSGGTPHSEVELTRVRRLLVAEESSSK